jgi:glutaredoxin 3
MLIAKCYAVVGIDQHHGVADTIMAKIEIYTTMICPYCSRAKKLLDAKGAQYSEIDVMTDGKLRAEMRARAGGRTSVPQIFINGEHIGGCDDLYALDRQGGLAPKLAQAG